MEKNSHPLEILADKLEERGILIIDNVKSLPVYREAYISPHLIVCLNHEGSVRAEYDMQQVYFNRHDMAMVLPGHTLFVQESSSDYKATLLVISQNLLKWLLENMTHFTLFELHNISSYHLTEKQFESVLAYFKMLDAISHINHPAWKDMLATQISIGTHMCNLFIFDNDNNSYSAPSEKQSLLNRFYNNIIDHYNESREVSYYAKRLYLSPKYFGTTIRQLTGIGAREWIARYVVIQAKNMLRQKTNLNIQQIAHLLGFDESTTFTRYFKAVTGITPSDYRKKL